MTMGGVRSSGSSPDRAQVSQARLACVGVTVRFGGVVAVNDVSLSLSPATIMGLIGPNGAGKSTLFGVLSGLIHPSHGKVLLDGEDITGIRPQLRAVRGLARTFQHPELFTGLTVREHLVIAHRAKHARRRIWSDLLTMGSLRPPAQAERAIVDELVELLGLGSVAGRPAQGLPVGMARLVELGRALAASPTVLLLDEPTSGLDSSETEELGSTLRSVTRERGISVLLIEHDVELVMRLSSAVFVLDFGMLIASGSPEEVRANPAVRAAYLGEKVSDSDAEESECAAEPGALSSLKSAVSSPATGAEPSEGAPLLAVENLSVRYGEAVALNGVSFCLGEGKAVAVLGANGAGKSSLARALSGLVPSREGRIVFAGDEINTWPPHRIRRAGLVQLPEGRAIFRELTVIENLRMAAATLGGRQARQQGVELALEIFRPLVDRRNQTAHLLSGGEQQMLSLARALITSPKLVIADEMSLGLAPHVVDLAFDALDRARQAAVTIILIEQYVHRALAFADECLVLQRDAVAWSGPASAAPTELLSHYLGSPLTTTS